MSCIQRLISTYNLLTPPGALSKGTYVPMLIQQASCSFILATQESLYVASVESVSLVSYESLKVDDKESMKLKTVHITQAAKATL